MRPYFSFSTFTMENVPNTETIDLVSCDCCGKHVPENETHVFTQVFGGERVCNYCLPKYKYEAIEAGDDLVVAEIIAYEKTL